MSNINVRVLDNYNTPKQYSYTQTYTYTICIFTNTVNSVVNNETVYEL